MPVVWPPAALRQAFVETVRDYRRQIRILTAMSDKLGEARDLLLPRVMSGEVAV
jgi:type I restriction enzyme S subunit